MGGGAGIKSALVISVPEKKRGGGGQRKWGDHTVC